MKIHIRYWLPIVQLLIGAMLLYVGWDQQQAVLQAQRQELIVKADYVPAAYLWFVAINFPVVIAFSPIILFTGLRASVLLTACILIGVWILWFTVGLWFDRRRSLTSGKIVIRIPRVVRFLACTLYLITCLIVLFLLLRAFGDTGQPVLFEFSMVGWSLVIITYLVRGLVRMIKSKPETIEFLSGDAH